MSDTLVLVAIALAALSGVPGLFCASRSAGAARVAAGLLVSASIIGALGGLRALAAPTSPTSLPWKCFGAALQVHTDGIAAVFLLPVFLVSGAGAIYGLEYWSGSEHPDNARKLRLFYGLLTAALALLLVAHSTILFLFGWEIMALSAFFLVTTEDHEESVREAGLVYLIATRFGTLALFAMFGLLRVMTGQFAFVAPASGSAPGVASAVFLLAVVGFGFKAGIMPLHMWLPGAHASAPSHVSALMSGVLIKMGIYGLVRITSLFEQPPLWWGTLLLVLGVVSGVLGVVFAIAQHDIKRLLAYHSVENIGIIVIGLGIAMLGRSLGRADLVTLGLAGALLHVWNHGLFKALLFLSAGAVVHATHTREIDELGGLLRAMPRTASFFLVGAVAICGLPPLNGFVSEMLVYLGLLRTATSTGNQAWLAGALAAPALALIGALALSCFVKVFGATFLGHPRSAHAKHAHECGPRMLGPMLLLAAPCVLIGLLPALTASTLEAATAAWLPASGSQVVRLAQLAPFAAITLLALALLGLVAACWALLSVRVSRGSVSATGTWDCGYAAPAPSMQYSASSFAEMTVGLFSWALRPQVHRSELGGPFPRPTTFHTHTPDAVLDRLLLPSIQGIGRAFSWLRWIQQGSVHLYLGYVVLTVIALHLWP
ncbi:MAG TPA: proton-conducting transporter membrane subunit [Polyangiales bacterium]